VFDYSRHGVGKTTTSQIFFSGSTSRVNVFMQRRRTGLLALFRDWLIMTRKHGVRQSGYRTASGEIYEFFTDDTSGQIELRQEFDNFSDFLTLCSTDPSAAAETLVPFGLGRAGNSDLVARFGREVRRLQLDLSHERERRILIIRHNLEEELVEEGIELRAVPSAQIHALIDQLVPGASASSSFALLAGPQIPHAINYALNINQQVINAVESTIIQNVQGTIHLGPQAKEFLALIERFGGEDTTLLEAAVHQLEDKDAPQGKRSAANQRLKNFLSRIAGSLQDVSLELLEKYLEKKMGM
jgi:hypothetical protein